MGGGGHMSASNALETYLKEDHDVVQCCLLADILKSFDPILFATFGKCAGEATYNAITPYKQWWLLNLIYRLGRLYFLPFEPFMRKRIVQYLKDTNADMVISVIPMFSKITLQACKELDIPFLLMPTDLDIRSFVYNIHYPTYKKFHLSLIFDDTSIKNFAYRQGINNHYISYNGFPLRPEFYEHKEPVTLRTTMKIPQDKPVIMILMGSLGTGNLELCVKSLQELTVPVHLLVCIGKYQAIKERLLAIELAPSITMDIIEETNRISDYMAISNLLITKSGTASFCEAIHMHLPMIIDATTSSALIWEKFNHKFTIKNGLGMVMKQYDQLAPYVQEFFQNPNMARDIQYNLNLIRSQDTPEKIRTRTARMLRPAYQYGNLAIAFGKKSRFQ
jgi:processive 1,2-diacylglycerol beta-glucosyltransferase